MLTNSPLMRQASRSNVRAEALRLAFWVSSELSMQCSNTVGRASVALAMKSAVVAARGVSGV